MPMKRLFTLLVLAAPLLLGGCEEDEETLSAQQQRIVSFLTSTHAPRLVSVEELEADSQLPFYETVGDGAYRYIETFYNPDRTNWPEVGDASRVTITFRAYLFDFSSITDRTMPFYSNDPLLRDAYYEAGLTPGAWSFEPMTIDMSSTGIINGLRLALLGCRAGDRAEAYMSYNMAYGGDNFGIIPRESPIAVFFTVDSVE